MSLFLVPCGRDAAFEYIRAHHRHHRPPQGYKFAIAAQDAQDGTLHGVVTVGRPVARGIDDGFTLEVTRCCTDGARNACSLLYGAARRAAFELGYRRIVTYTLESEAGSSLRGAGWTLQARTGEKRAWGRAGGRTRSNAHPVGSKFRWVAERHDYPDRPELFTAVEREDPQLDLL